MKPSQSRPISNRRTTFPQFKDRIRDALQIAPRLARTFPVSTCPRWTRTTSRCSTWNIPMRVFGHRQTNLLLLGTAAVHHLPQTPLAPNSRKLSGPIFDQQPDARRSSRRPHQSPRMLSCYTFEGLQRPISPQASYPNGLDVAEEC